MKILKEKQQGPDERKKTKTVVVGVRMDQQSPELLTWALVKVANAGDRVVALHIATSYTITNPASLLASFQSVIGVYEGFCNLKQIDLKLKVCRGSSIRRVLVQEAKSFEASSLIVGVAKNPISIGSSSTSIAKYCAKKLGGDCSVLAVSSGKVVFQNEAKLPLSSEEPDFCFLLRQTSSVSSSKPHDHKNHRLSMFKGRGKRDSDPPKSLMSSLDLSRRSCSVCASSISRVPLQTESKLPNSSSESRPGWPLLRRTTFTNRKDDPPEKSKISVVQWAMRLPSRYSASLAVHPDPKKAKTDFNFDKESRVVTPLGTDSSSPSMAADEEEKQLPEEMESLREKYSSVCRLFSYQELVIATSNFSPDFLVGKGGSSRVYKGNLSDGEELAVKILKATDDALQEFVSEVEIVTALNHPNIISLLGFCFENNNLILVYNFLPRGSLEEILHGEKENKKVLNWLERYKIAVGVAKALDYLHGGVGDSQPVIHRDVKSSNILLDDDFEPQLSDFGLAQWASSSSTHIICSDVAGTFGYLAPEYFMYGKVNEKIDVYAFGVVLLELLSGRKPVAAGCPKGQESLVMWAKPILQGGKVKQLLDPCLGNLYDNNQMERMALAASLCIRRASRSRPRIALVLKLLQGDDDVLWWAKSEVGVSEEFDGSAPLDSNIQSHINLALLDIEWDETLSVSSVDPSVTLNTSLEDYLRGRCSRSLSFD